MQLTLAFLEQTDHPPSSSAAAWEQLDEAARRAALEGLAHLIARMLAGIVTGTVAVRRPWR